MIINKIISIKNILLFILTVEIFTPGSGIYKFDNLIFLLIFPIVIFAFLSKLNNTKFILLFISFYIIIYLLISTVTTNNVNITVFDGYFRGIIGFYIGYLLYKIGYKKERFQEFIVYWLQVPIFLIGLIYVYDMNLFKKLYEMYTLSISIQWRFGNIFDLPYMAATFYTICLFFTFEIFNESKSNYHKILLVLLIFVNIYFGILTISKTYFMGLIIILSLNFFKSNHKILLSLILISFIGFIFISVSEEKQKLFYLFTETTPFEILEKRYEDGGQIENIVYNNIYFGSFFEENHFATDSFYIDLFYNFGILGSVVFAVLSLYLLLKLNFKMKIFFIMIAIESLGSNAFMQNKMTFLIWAIISYSYFHINTLKRNNYARNSNKAQL